MFFLLVALALLQSCEKDFDIDVGENEPQLIVEAYINNALPLYNYVILTRSQSYYTPDLNSVPASGATVYITEGERRGDNIVWNESGKTRLQEIALPQLPQSPLNGVYFDSRLATDYDNALRGKLGKHYRLEIEAEGKQYTATTEILQPINIDSLTSGDHFQDDDENDEIVTRARLTVHYQDPDTLGNTLLYYWRRPSDQLNFGWGGFGTNRYTPGTDDLTNGEYIHLTHSTGFNPGDTVRYYMANVRRDVYNFWDSYNKARSNGGPFATPVTLSSTITGENVIGCFSGFAITAVETVIR